MSQQNAFAHNDQMINVNGEQAGLTFRGIFNSSFIHISERVQRRKIFGHRSIFDEVKSEDKVS